MSGQDLGRDPFILFISFGSTLQGIAEVGLVGLRVLGPVLDDLCLDGPDHAAFDLHRDADRIVKQGVIGIVGADGVRGVGPVLQAVVQDRIRLLFRLLVLLLSALRRLAAAGLFFVPG